MSRTSHILGSSVTGISSRSHHKYWSDCSPIRETTRIDKIKQSVDTWNFIHQQELLESRLAKSRVLYPV